jgi:hypothetical protein
MRVSETQSGQSLTSVSYLIPLTELIRLGGTGRFARRDGRNVFWIVFNTVVSLATFSCTQ